MRMLRAGWLLLAALLAGAPVQTPAPKYMISGLVVNELTNQPIKRAFVTITQNDHPDRTASLFTAADGRFTFTDVPAGKFTLQALAHGEQHLFQQDGQYSTGIVTGPGIDSEHIVFRFPTGASLTVKLQDEEGEPVPGALVTLFAQRVNDGWPQIINREQQGSNNEGTVRFSHLEPGTYYVAVAGRPWYAQNQPEPQNEQQQAEAAALDVAFPLMFYPNSTTPDGAAPTQLAAGQSASVQMSLHAVPAVKIVLTGVPNPGEEQPGVAPGMRTVVEAIGPGGVRFNVPSIGYGGAGEQQVQGIAPGNYVVSVSGFGRRSGRVFGSAKVNVAGDTSINAAELAKTSVQGKVLLEGATPGNEMALRMKELSTGQTAFCRIGRDGAFECREGRGMGANIAPGRYQFALMNAPELYIKSITAQGARYAGGVLEVREGAAVSLHVVVAKGVTKLDGIALLDSKPLAGAMVLLVPRDAASGSEIARDQSDWDGTFTLFNVHPGHYYLIAIDHGRNLAYRDPRVIAPYLANAQKMDVPLTREQRVSVDVQKRVE